jgi:hypothetical protein
MNTSLREALAERIDAAGLPRVDLDLVVSLGEARLLQRRRRRTTALIACTVAAAAAVVLVVRQTPDTSTQPSGPPTTGVSQGTPALVPKTRPGRVNEFVLQFHDPAAADRALVHAVQQMKRCPRPPWARSFGQDLVHTPILRYPDVSGTDAQWRDERLTNIVPGTNAGSTYAFFVARADNVLVMIENNGMDDDAGWWRETDVSLALPQYRPGTVVPGGEVVAAHPYPVPVGTSHWLNQWPPRMTRCVADPSTWGAQQAQGNTRVSSNNK